MFETLRAYGAHAFTATGAVFAMLALLAAVEEPLGGDVPLARRRLHRRRGRRVARPPLRRDDEGAGSSTARCSTSSSTT
jgi:hypothetical protein